MFYWIKQCWKENKGLFVFLLLMFVFRSSLADWNSVPTGSMKPNIVEGDRILINKVAYDLKLPFTNIKLADFADPERGDIIIFNSKVSDIRLVKRVVAVPGDVVSMRNNVLSINGKELDYEALANVNDKIELSEDLFGKQYSIRITPENSRASSFDPVLVPENAYMALGDNRDNSADSRFIGFVPRDEIIGRSRTVVMSLNYDKYYIPRSDRFFKPL